MTIGLWIFVTVFVVNAFGLFYDTFAVDFGFPTITEMVKRHLWLGLVILSIELIGVIGFVKHFYL